MRRASKVFLSCGGALVLATAGFVMAGPIDPPAGPVASTYKTLNEVRPGKPIHQSDLPLLITQPGEYYLAENVDFAPAAGAAAISIQVSPASGVRSGDVRLDLNGYSMRWNGGGSPDATSYAIYVAPVEGPQIHIQNGSIAGFGTGVQALSSVSIEKVNFANNGSFPNGGGIIITGGTQSIVRQCTLIRNAVGIRFDNDTGLNQFGGSVIEDCSLTLNSNGVQADSGVTVRHCILAWNVFDALTLGSDNIAEDCVLQRNYANSPAAISVIGDRNRVAHCTVQSNMRGGLRVTGNNNTIEDNNIVGNSIGETSVNGGLQVVGTATGNLFRGNVVRNNTNTAGTTRNYNFTSLAPNEYQLQLSQIPETINVTATVTLSGSMTMPAGVAAHGLTISANDVTVDFAGHSISGTAAAQNGVAFSNAARDCRIMNGTVRGFNAGVVINDGSAANGSDSVVENMRIVGCRREAILGGNVARILNCTVTANGSATVPTISVGDGAVIEGNLLAGNSNTGATISTGNGARVVDNVVQANTGRGIQVNDSATVSGNNVVDNGGAGIASGTGCHLHHNTVRGNQQEGIMVNQSSTVTDNTLDFNCRGAGSQTNLLVYGNFSRIERNTVVNGEVGIGVSGIRNIVLSNCVSSASNPIAVGAGNAFGPVIGVAGVGDISATANANHPRANFVY